MISISSHIKLDPSYWKVAQGNIENLNLCNNETEFFVIDPSRISSLGGSKSTVLTPELLSTNLKYVTNDDWSQPRLGFLDSTWTAKGWTARNEETFFSELQNWIKNNFNNRKTNIDLNNMCLVTVRGQFDGSSYTVAFCYPGS